MNELSEALGTLTERLARRPRSRWLLRAALAGAGLSVQLWMTLLAGPAAWTMAGVIAVLLGVVLARSALPLVVALLLGLEALVLGLSPLSMVPVAAGLFVWHVCATLCDTGRPWAVVDSRLVRSWHGTTLAAVTVAILAAVLAHIATLAALPEIAAVSLLVATAVVVAALGVLIIFARPSR